MTCKVKIDVSAGLIELEGDATFVASFFDKVVHLVEAAGFGAHKSQPKSKSNDATTDEPIVPNPADDPGAADKPKKARKAVRKPPAGASARDRILALKSDGFFKSHRTTGDIVAGLAKKGWTHKSNQVGAALTPMFNRGEIQRTNDGSGFSYYWDRD
ncbi:MAG: hypothetical protein E7773_09525 [Sphingomonas sp.]|uniref:hypothetical protein n=1 Tax=Sphingomonas sp. TaxID=28214 RepID=UPI0012131969|nr:hypothetical protein [Sphingomonas sp.]THD36155.1 MAG: hypothetical protein E7773_09525 [Sphingomonas sp.]